MLFKNFQHEIEKINFAEKAATFFEKHPRKTSYTDGGIRENCFFALRFGLNNDCVVVFKIGEDTPVNFQNIINVSKQQCQKV